MGTVRYRQESVNMGHERSILAGGEQSSIEVCIGEG